MYALRQEDIVEVTASRAKQLLTTSPETFSLKGREEIWLFLDNCCEEAEEEIVDFSRLWEEYRSWSEKQGKTSMLSKEDFEKELSGLFEVVESEGKTCLKGLRLREEG